MEPLSVVLRTPQPQFRRRQPRHAEFLGLPFSLLRQPEVVQLIAEQGGAPYRYIVTPNAHHVVTIYNAPGRLLPIYQEAWLSLCDSRIVRALARFNRLPLPLVTGSDLVATLLRALDASDSAHTPRRILVIGPQRDAEMCCGQPIQISTSPCCPHPQRSGKMSGGGAPWRALAGTGAGISRSYASARRRRN